MALACVNLAEAARTSDRGATPELVAMAAAAIGGTSPMGGRGRMPGARVGVLIFDYLTNILPLRGVGADVPLFITGIIIAAVLLQKGYIQRLTTRLQFPHCGK